MFDFYRRNCLVVLVVVSALGALHQPARGADLLNKYFVLSVGINEYEFKQLKTLRGCVNDAKSMADLFGGGDPALSLDGSATLVDILVPSRKNTTLLLDREATQANILAAFSNLGDAAPENSEVLINLSGHGFRSDGSWIFCTHDFDPSDPEGTGLTGSAIHNAIAPLMRKNCRILMILDSCHSGEFVKSCEFQFREQGRPEGSGLIVLASSTPSQTSWDCAVNGKGESHGLFTSELLSAFNLLSDMNDRDDALPESKPISISLNEVKRSLSLSLRQAVFDLRKFPGLLHPEQDFLADWSMSISDTQTLMEYAPPKRSTSEGLLFYPPPPRPQSESKKLPFVLPDEPVEPALQPQVIQTEQPLDGVWMWKRPIVAKMAPGEIQNDNLPSRFETDSKGNTLFEVLILGFDGRGNYEVAYQIGRDKPVSNTGRYQYQPGQHFRLVYDNGSDTLGLKSLTADELVIEFDQCEFKNRQRDAFWQSENIQTLRFERVTPE